MTIPFDFLRTTGVGLFRGLSFLLTELQAKTGQIRYFLAFTGCDLLELYQHAFKSH
jgi:hypothetical protein